MVILKLKYSRDTDFVSVLLLSVLMITIIYFCKVSHFKLQYKELQYSQRHSEINHCDRDITHLGDLDISFVYLNISSTFLLHLECYLLQCITEKAYQNK
jgi:hypothetical protein